MLAANYLENKNLAMKSVYFLLCSFHIFIYFIVNILYHITLRTRWLVSLLWELYMHDGNPTFRKSQRRTHQIKGNCMFYIHAGFTRAFHAETIFTYDKELDDRPSDQTKQMRDKMQSPSRCFVCWLWDFPHSHVMSEDKNISLEIFQHDFLIQRYKV